MRLDRNHPVPLYQQLKSVLAARISDGTLPPGARFPSEREIHEQYGVSRNTVREALRELLRERVIETVAGRGTFVACPPAELEVSVSLGGFTADMRRQNFEPSSLLLDARLVDIPEPTLLAALHLTAPAELIRLERLRLVNGRPLALHTVYLPHALCPQLLQHNLAEHSLIEILRSEYGLRLARAEEQVYAALGTPHEVDLLKLTPPASVLRTERTSYLDDRRVIEFAQATYCGEWYHLTLTVEPVGVIRTDERRAA